MEILIIILVLVGTLGVFSLLFFFLDGLPMVEPLEKLEYIAEMGVVLAPCVVMSTEEFGEPYFPIPNVCELLKHKYDFLLEYYHNAGIFHSLFMGKPKYPLNKEWQEILLNFGYKEYEQYQF